MPLITVSYRYLLAIYCDTFGYIFGYIKDKVHKIIFVGKLNQASMFETT